MTGDNLGRGDQRGVWIGPGEVGLDFVEFRIVGVNCSNVRFKGSLILKLEIRNRTLEFHSHFLTRLVASKAEELEKLLLVVVVKGNPLLMDRDAKIFRDKDTEAPKSKPLLCCRKAIQ